MAKEAGKNNEVVLAFTFLPIECSLFSLCFKIKTNAPFMYKAPGQRYDKSQKHRPICLWQSVVVFQKAAWRKLFQTLLRVENRLSIADYFCVYIMQYVSGMPCNCSPLPSQAYSFSEPMTTRTRLRHNRFVQFLAIN